MRAGPWVALVAIGCTGTEPEDKGVPDDTGADADPDDDTDTDADTDADVDEDSLSGTVIHTRVEDGVDVCNEAVDLSGTPYTGACPGCDFAFDITATPNGAIGDCTPVEFVSPIFDWTDY